MPRFDLDGHSLNYALDGPPDAPAVVFSNSLGTSLAMWDAQVASLSGRYRCLRYDTRGHGLSDALDAPTTLDDLAGDLVRLLDGLGIGRAHVVGLSLGGMTAQALAAAHPERVDRLVLMATAAQLGPVSAWNERAATARRAGMAALAETILARWFTPAFRETPAAQAVRAQVLATPPIGYARACEAIRDMDLRERIGGITAPTLIISGEQDPSTPPALGEAIHARIAGSAFEVLPGVAHMLNVEAADRVTPRLAAFLSGG
ncbi:3-oxoadipate enol-lactonase [Methylobacterium sp. A54F]